MYTPVGVSAYVHVNHCQSVKTTMQIYMQNENIGICI